MEIMPKPELFDLITSVQGEQSTELKHEISPICTCLSIYIMNNK